MTTPALSLLAVLLASPALAGGGRAKTIPPIASPISAYAVSSPAQLKAAVGDIGWLGPAKAASARAVGALMLREGPALLVAWRGENAIAVVSPKAEKPGTIFSFSERKPRTDYSGRLAARLAAHLRAHKEENAADMAESYYLLSEKIFDGAAAKGEAVSGPRGAAYAVWNVPFLLRAGEARRELVTRDARTGRLRQSGAVAVSSMRDVSFLPEALPDGRVLTKLKSGVSDKLSSLAAADPRTGELRLFPFSAAYLQPDRGILHRSGKSLLYLSHQKSGDVERLVNVVVASLVTGERRLIPISPALFGATIDAINADGHLFVSASRPGETRRHWRIDLKTGRVF